MSARHLHLSNREAGVPSVSLLSPLARATASGVFVLPADGWYQLAPLGEFPHHDEDTGEVVLQIINAEAARALAASGVGKELLIDFDHESYDLSKRTEAAGWITNMEARPDGVWFQARWTPLGTTALRGGIYRFISPTWQREDCAELGGGRVRPLRVSDAGLTNRPNLSGLFPLSNRRQGATENPLPSDTRQVGGATAAKQKKQTTPMEELIALLGLPAGADEAAIVTKVKDLLAENATIKGETAEEMMNSAGIKASDPDRANIKAALISNRAGGAALLRRLVGAGGAPARALTNRETARAPGQRDESAMTVDKAIEAEAAKQPGIKREEAYQRAKRNYPEAFTS